MAKGQPCARRQRNKMLRANDHTAGLAWGQQHPLFFFQAFRQISEPSLIVLVDRLDSPLANPLQINFSKRYKNPSAMFSPFNALTTKNQQENSPVISSIFPFIPSMTFLSSSPAKRSLLFPINTTGMLSQECRRICVSHFLASSREDSSEISKMTNAAFARQKQLQTTVLYLQWPAVSQSSKRQDLPMWVTALVRTSMPIVYLLSWWWLEAYFRRMEVLPTETLPRMIILMGLARRVFASSIIYYYCYYHDFDTEINAGYYCFEVGIRRFLRGYTSQCLAIF